MAPEMMMERHVGGGPGVEHDGSVHSHGGADAEPELLVPEASWTPWRTSAREKEREPDLRGEGRNRKKEGRGGMTARRGVTVPWPLDRSSVVGGSGDAGWPDAEDEVELWLLHEEMRRGSGRIPRERVAAARSGLEGVCLARV